MNPYFCAMGRKKTDKIVFENVKVLDAGAKGVSVAKAPDGKVIFIPNVVPGDVVDVQTFKKRKAYYEGKAVNFHEYSEHRIDPICEHFGVCGGCKWQSMKYEQQLFYKNQEVYNHLKRIGKVELPEFEPILGSKEQFFYRNKMEFGFSSSRWMTQARNRFGSRIRQQKCRWFPYSENVGQNLRHQKMSLTARSIKRHP